MNCPHSTLVKMLYAVHTLAFAVLVAAARVTAQCPGDDGNPVAGAVFEELTQSCFLVAGAICDKSATAPPYPCLPNSVCLTTGDPAGGGSTVDRCTCLEGLTPNSDSYCYLAHQRACNLQQDLCDPNQKLACSPVTAVCDCGETAFFEWNRCVLRAGRVCGRKIGDNGDERGRVARECGANADCVRDLEGDIEVCACQGQHVESEDGRCLVPHGRACGARAIGEQDDCLHPFVCDTDSGVPGTCVCPEGTYFDRATDTCFIKANHTCTPEDEQKARLECTPNSRCSARNKKCVCVAPLKPTEHGTCHLSHGDDCEGNYECDPAPGLVCLHSICECPYGAHFDRVRGVCEVVAGLPCDRNGSTGFRVRSCVLNAECLQIGGEWLCACVNGTSPNADRLCFARKGEPCDTEEDTGVRCNPNEHLTCERGQCGCASDMEYILEPQDGTGNSCRLLAGATCLTPTPACIPDAICANKTCHCLLGFEGTHCDISFGSNCTAGTSQKPCASNIQCIGGTCLCPAGYNHVPVSEKHTPKCLPGFHLPCLAVRKSIASIDRKDESCSPTLVCDANNENPTMGLCVCAHPHQVYDPPHCVSLVGTRCTLDNDGEVWPMYCTANAECVGDPANEVRRYGTCECHRKYTGSFNETCVETAESNFAFIRTLYLEVFILTFTLILFI